MGTRQGQSLLNEEERAEVSGYATLHGNEAAAEQFGISIRQVIRLKRVVVVTKAKFSEEYLTQVINQLRGNNLSIPRLSELLTEIPNMLSQLVTLERERINGLKSKEPSPMERITVTGENVPKKLKRWRMK